MESIKISFLVLLLAVYGAKSGKAPDLQYKERVISEAEDDLFGWSLGVKNGMLAIGAPSDNDDEGSVTFVRNGVTVAKLMPRTGEFFGREVRYLCTLFSFH